MLGDHVDGALFCSSKVAERVFGVREATGEADGEEGWVMVYYLSVRERGEICRGTCSLQLNRSVSALSSLKFASTIGDVETYHPHS